MGRLYTFWTLVGAFPWALVPSFPCALVGPFPGARVWRFPRALVGAYPWACRYTVPFQADLWEHLTQSNVLGLWADLLTKNCVNVIWSAHSGSHRHCISDSARKPNSVFLDHRGIDLQHLGANTKRTLASGTPRPTTSVATAAKLDQHMV